MLYFVRPIFRSAFYDFNTTSIFGIHQVSKYLAKTRVSFGTNKILILGKVGFQSDQITAASWSGNTCQPSNQLIITLIRLLFGLESES